MDDITKPPKTSVSDHLHTVARAGIGLLPLGGPAVELFNALVSPPLERRRDEWRAAVGTKLQSLIDARVLTEQDLAGNEVFVSIVMQASVAAVKTHHREKLEALRNAVVNSVLPQAPDEITQHIFLRMIDELSASHLQIIKLFQDPRRWFETTEKRAPTFAITSSSEQVLLAAFPSLIGHRPIYDQLVKELNDAGLLSVSLHTMMTASGAFGRGTTGIGDQFLRFIAEPPTPVD